MSKKQLLEEATVRKFMKLANLEPLTGKFLKEGYTYEEEDELDETNVASAVHGTPGKLKKEMSMPHHEEDEALDVGMDDEGGEGEGRIDPAVAKEAIEALLNVFGLKGTVTDDSEGGDMDVDSDEEGDDDLDMDLDADDEDDTEDDELDMDDGEDDEDEDEDELDERYHEEDEDELDESQHEEDEDELDEGQHEEEEDELDESKHEEEEEDELDENKEEEEDELDESTLSEDELVENVLRRVTARLLSEARKKKAPVKESGKKKKPSVKKKMEEKKKKLEEKKSRHAKGHSSKKGHKVTHGKGENPVLHKKKAKVKDVWSGHKDMKWVDSKGPKTKAPGGHKTSDLAPNGDHVVTHGKKSSVTNKGKNKKKTG